MAMVLSTTCQQYFGYIGAVSFYSWKKLEYRFKLSMDPSIGNCTVQPIDGTGFDAKFVDGSNMQYVRIRTPAEFFYFDKTK
jgi:hypothetical protein